MGEGSGEARNVLGPLMRIWLVRILHHEAKSITHTKAYTVC